MTMEKDRADKREIERGRVYGDKQYPVMVYIVSVVTEHGSFDASHCWTKDNSANADSLAYLHIDYLWLP